MKTVGVLGGCGKVILDVEAVSPRGIHSRVLTADVDARLGLETCERCRFDQAAKLKSSVRSGAGGSPDSSHRQCCRRRRRWRGTK